MKSSPRGELDSFTYEFVVIETASEMAACPFRRTSSSHPNGALKRSVTVRQSSFQVPSAEDVEEDDKNTLNLKSLSAAIRILTAPQVHERSRCRRCRISWMLVEL